MRITTFFGQAWRQYERMEFQRFFKGDRRIKGSCSRVEFIIHPAKKLAPVASQEFMFERVRNSDEPRLKIQGVRRATVL